VTFSERREYLGRVASLSISESTANLILDFDRFVKAGNVGYSAFHDDSSLPVIFSSFSSSVL
jgi:hypothetical protein